MFSSSTFLSFLVLALSAATTNATPIQQRGQGPTVLGITAKINASGFKNLADIDRARLAAMMAQVQDGNSGTHTKRKDGTVVATDNGVSYTANVGIGTPPTYCKPLHSPLASLPDTSDRYTPHRYRQREHLARGQQNIC